MKRRKALQTVTLSPLAFALNCSKDPTSPSSKEHEIKSTQPYYNPRIETDTNSTINGTATLTTSSKSLEVRVENESSQPLNNIEVGMVTSPEERVIVAIDPSYNYMPSILFPSSNVAKPASWQDVIKLYETAKNMTKGVLNNLAVKYIPESIINRSAHMDPLHRLKDAPFIIYEGDYSFNEIIDITKFTTSIVTGIASLLGFSGQDGEFKGIISILRGGGITMNMVPYVMDEVIDTLNKAGLKIDKDKPYSWYKTGLPPPFSSLFPQGLQFSFFLSTVQQESVFDIKHYFPIKPGNEWTFYSKYGYANAECTGLTKIDGNDLVVFDSSDIAGTLEYYGFINDELRYFGFYTEDTGDIAFNPPLLIGDLNIRVGKNYTTKSKIIFKEYLADLEGSVTETLNYNGLENVTVKAGTFGNCLKATEIMDISLKNTETGEKVSEKSEAYHWLAKNIGKVKTQFSDEYSDYSFELSSANINGLSIPKIAQINPNNTIVSPYSALPYLIRKALK